MSSRRGIFIHDLKRVIPVLAIGTAIIWFFDLDLQVQSYFYDNGWPLKEHPLIAGFYNYGVFIGIAVGLLAMLVVLLSYQNEKFYKFRRLGFFLIFCLVVGPGIIVNGVFKENWGRPRPRQVEEFGGNKDFWPVLCKCGPEVEGKSFPCGHCSMAFYLLMPFFYLRNRNRRIARLILIAGFLFAGVMGLARISAGGHFLSDVLWAGGMMWLVGLTGSFMFKLNIDPDEAKPIVKKKSKTGRIVTYVVAPIVISILMVATPYYQDKNFELSHEHTGQLDSLKIEFPVGNLVLSQGTELNMKYQVRGFGVPTSKMIIRYLTGHFYLDESGMFTKVTSSAQIDLPDNTKNIIVTKKGDITLTEMPTSSLILRLPNGHFINEVDKRDFSVRSSENGELVTFVNGTLVEVVSGL